ncbi:T9SS type A sorting domain-containing protein, partial [bacterium]|nr:T9SS type A sorting domain-containing protein [bacterium]
DAIGEPENSDKIIEDMTLRRKNTVLVGNPIFDFAEWDQFEKDNIEGLGTHSTNPYAPAISDITVSPEFIESGNEIEISAVITPVVGSISTVTIKYGADDNLVNSVDCWLENPTTNLWLGNLGSQPGNSKISYKIVATDDSGNSGESQVSSFLVASQQTTDISYIHENIETLTGSIVTIRGIMTIGAGVLRDDRTSAYIQDTSGKGLNLYHSQLFTDMNRGDEIRAVGYVEKYYSTIEVKDFIYERISTGNALPATQTISITEANSGAWEGTLVKFYGKITEIVAVGAGNKITVSDDNSNTTVVMIWGTTGIDINNYSVDNSYWFRGVESKYNDVAQLLVGYSEDIGDEVAIDEKVALSAVFKLNPAYPNPFNPSTNIHWQMDKSCDYELAAFNILGQKVDVISGGFGLAGFYTKTWNANNFPTGVYFIQLISENRKLTQKVILLK